MPGPAFLRGLARPEDRLALRVGERSLSYPELATACRGYLAQLRAAGARPGDRVAVVTTRSIATPILLAAHAAAGFVSVPLNEKLGARELDHILQDAEPVRTVIGRWVGEPETDGPNLSDLLEVELDPAELDHTSSSAVALEHPVDDDPLLILYTSGTTGAPKGALLRYANAAFDLDGLAEAWGWSAKDTVVHALPLFHVHGLVLGWLGTLRAGAALRWIPRFDPKVVAGALGDAPSSVLFSVPTMIHRLADAAEADESVAEGLRNARLLVSGSAGLPVREHRRIEAITGRGVFERYGLTESLINCAVRVEEGPRPGYVGRPLSGIELRLVDDERQPLDAHDDATIGEVAVRGPNVFSGYLNRPDATAAVLDPEGWFFTGDLATRTEDGAIRIVGRCSTDLIKTGGFKVGAGEVEAVMLEDPAVAEVAVVGVDDPDLGQRIVAFVVARAGASVDEAALIERVATELTPHKRPRAVRLIDELPRNAMGKVVKPRLLSEA